MELTSLEIELAPIQPIAHFSSNSYGATIAHIQSCEQKHWLEGLRAAELCIDKQQNALQVNYMLQRKQQREIEAKKERLEELRSCSPINPEGVLRDREVAQINREIAQLQDDIQSFEWDQQRLVPLIRDAGFELKTALQQRSRILTEHPEVLQMTYEEIQTFLTPQCVENQRAQYIAARVLGMPETAGAAILETPNHQIEDLLRTVGLLQNDFFGIAQKLKAEAEAEAEVQQIGEGGNNGTNN